MKPIRNLLCAALALAPTTAFAWGPTGHQIVGAIADAQLHAHAKAHVASLLNMTLKTAGPWADCVRDVKDGPSHGHYVENQQYKPSCGVFWTAAAEAEAVSYADRNWDNCNRDGGQECHTQYHFTDVDIDRQTYQMGQHGTNDHDLVHAIGAAIAVLKGGAAPVPFQIAGPREALLMLAHLIGDIHQPLHVGAIYLDAQGHAVDPDAATHYDPATFTRGGNFLFDGMKKLHFEWAPAIVPARVATSTRCPIRIGGSQPPTPAKRRNPESSMWVTIRPISSMCPTIASDRPAEVPATRAVELPITSPCTSSVKPRHASRNTDAGVAS